MNIQIPSAAVDALKLTMRRRKYADNPLLWASDRNINLWSVQRQIIESVNDNRRTCVYSCHDSGKSFLAGNIAAWWIESHPPGEAFVVTSAPTFRQVRAILWREISKIPNLIGRINQVEWWLPVRLSNGEIREQLVAFGQKPGDLDPTAFQGIHARYVLVIFDEACGIPKTIFDAGDTLLTNKDSHMLAIGNPDDPNSEFASVCTPGSGWSVIHISAFDTPCMTGEPVSKVLETNLISQLWIEEKAKKWIGEQCSKCGKKFDLLGIRHLGQTCECGEIIPMNPMYVSKVLGMFPESSEDTLIPLSWIRAAQERTLTPGEPNCLGVDVGKGGDRSVFAHRRGDVVRIIRRDQNPDIMATCGNVIADLRKTGASTAKIDEIGIGAGVVARGKEMRRSKQIDFEFVGINVGEAARDSDQFTRRRSELWWEVRERFQNGEIDIDPNDDDLAGQLASLRYERLSNGKIQVETKQSMKKRGLRSPDDADALALAFAEPRYRQIVYRGN